VTPHRVGRARHRRSRPDGRPARGPSCL